MSIFILLTRLINEEVHPSFSFITKEKEVVETIGKYLPKVKWIGNYAVMGPWDYLDIFEAEDMEMAIKVSTLVRYYGGAHTEVWPAQQWSTFEKLIHDLAGMIER